MENLFPWHITGSTSRSSFVRRWGLMVQLVLIHSLSLLAYACAATIGVLLAFRIMGG